MATREIVTPTPKPQVVVVEVDLQVSKEESTPSPAKRGRHHSPKKVEDQTPIMEKWTPRLVMEHLAQDTRANITVPKGVYIAGRYEVLEQIGRGAFGNVFLSMDRLGGKKAIKVIKSKHSGNRSVQRELQMLSVINALDPHNCRSFVVRLHYAGRLENHVLFIFDHLGPNLHSVLVQSKRVGFTIPQTQRIGVQLCIAINFLHSHGLVHNDIKPDNIAFVQNPYEVDHFNMTKLDIRLIDMGSTINILKYKLGEPCKVATTRQYCSPEFDLNARWTYSSDVWSVGATLVEVYSGQVLFKCDNEKEKCYLVEGILGQKIPEKMAKGSKFTFFDEQGKLKYGKDPLAFNIKIKPLDDYVKNPKDLGTIQFFDLMKKMLQILPEKRIPTDEIFMHLFWTFERGVTPLN